MCFGAAADQCRMNGGRGRQVQKHGSHFKDASELHKDTQTSEDDPLERTFGAALTVPLLLDFNPLNDWLQVFFT